TSRNALVVVAYGLALKPASSRPCFTAFIAATACLSSRAYGQLTSKPALPASSSSALAFFASVVLPSWPSGYSYSTLPAVPGGRMLVDGRRVTPAIVPLAFQYAWYGNAQLSASRTFLSLILVWSRYHMYVHGDVPSTNRPDS